MRQSTEKLWAMVSHLGMALIPFGGIGAMVIYLLHKDKSKYIAHHAGQSMWWLFCCMIGIVVLNVVGLTWFAAALYFVRVAMSAIGSFNAMSGKWYEYPLTNKIARRALG